jgi:hypothetical protein
VHNAVMEWQHVTDHDLERYCLGLVKDETELPDLEENIVARGSCADWAAEVQDYVDSMRVAALKLLDQL